MRKDRERARDRFIETARSQIGYRALPMKQSVFGQEAGYQGSTWNGSFLEWAAREAEVDLPPLTATGHALAVLIRANRIFRVPAVGDVVFLEAGADGSFSQPAVGLVTDVTEWGVTGAFKAVLGQTGNPAPRGNPDPTGVYERTFYETDVLAFARPRYGARSKFRVPAGKEKVDEISEVRMSHFQYGKSNRSIELIQRALSFTVPIRGAVRGKYDAQTRSAIASWQRQCGLVGSDADGTVDRKSLETLGSVTGLFTVKD